MRRVISFICAGAMVLGGGYFAITLSAHLMHWVVIGSAGISILGLLWLWEDFVSPIARRRTSNAPDHKERESDAGMRRQVA